MQRHLCVLDKKFPLANFLPRARRILESPRLIRGSQPMAGKRCQGKCWVWRSQTGKSPCCPQLSNVRVQEKTEMLFLKMQRMDKRPPRKFQLCIRIKTCNPSRQTLHQGQRDKGSAALNKALSREVGLSNLPNYSL